MAHSFPISASQTKALTSLGITVDANDDYSTASAKLEAAGVATNGQVSDVSPRNAKKIADADYAVLLRRDAADLLAYQSIDASCDSLDW